MGYEVLDNVIDCNSKYKAVMAGAALAVIGLDAVFVSVAPVSVHYMLAGVAADAYCKRRLPNTNEWKEVLGCAAGGFVGGMLVRRFSPISGLADNLNGGRPIVVV